MGKTFSIVRVLGFDIRADLSWLAMFGLILWSLGGGYFPSAYPSLSPPDTWTLALAVTAFLSVSIAAHELGHSLVSRKVGLPVRSITLFALGGLSEIGRDPDRARDEFAIAIAGPGVSFALALGFSALGWAGPAVVGLKLAAFGGSLGLANLWLGAFNLIPGSPLDGGRILHSVVWGLTGNARKATRFAGLAGQLFGIGMIVLGMLQMLTAQGMHGLWLILIGWYLLGAASREVAADSLRERLSDLTARDVMLTDCPIVPPAMTLDQFERKIAQRTDRNCFPVMGGGRVTGLITLDDLRSVPRNERARMTVGTVMKRVAELPAVPPEARAYEVLQQMARTDLHEMAVVESGEWRGIITLDGILARWRHDPRPGMPG